jgi:transcriptional adapter 2-alpha
MLKLKAERDKLIEISNNLRVELHSLKRKAARAEPVQNGNKELRGQREEEKLNEYEVNELKKLRKLERNYKIVEKELEEERSKITLLEEEIIERDEELHGLRKKKKEEGEKEDEEVEYEMRERDYEKENKEKKKKKEKKKNKGKNKEKEKEKGKDKDKDKEKEKDKHKEKDKVKDKDRELKKKKKKKEKEKGKEKNEERDVIGIGKREMNEYMDYLENQHLLLKKENDIMYLHSFFQFTLF